MLLSAGANNKKLWDGSISSHSSLWKKMLLIDIFLFLFQKVLFLHSLACFGRHSCHRCWWGGMASRFSLSPEFLWQKCSMDSHLQEFPGPALSWRSFLHLLWLLCFPVKRGLSSAFEFFLPWSFELVPPFLLVFWKDSLLKIWLEP